MRLQGWEERLAAVIEDARETFYEVGKHDCALFVNKCMIAITGVDYSDAWVDEYRKTKNGLKVIRHLGFDDLKEAATRVIGKPFVIAGALRRGDVTLYLDGEAQQHLGVCDGAKAVHLLEGKGTVHIPMNALMGGWRID